MNKKLDCYLISYQSVGSWYDKSMPSLRCLAGMGVREATLELRQGLNSYGGLQWRIFGQWTYVWSRNVLRMIEGVCRKVLSDNNDNDSSYR